MRTGAWGPPQNHFASFRFVKRLLSARQPALTMAGIPIATSAARWTLADRDRWHQAWRATERKAPAATGTEA